jgi:uncharacterized protein
VRRWWLLATFVLVIVLVAALGFRSVRSLTSKLPKTWQVRLHALRYGYSIDHGVRITTRDGVTLASSLYTPRNADGKLPTIYVRLPYNRLEEGLDAPTFFARRGYAVLVQDIRGKFESGGEFAPYRHGTDDGVDTLEWITHQPWSNGRVGTFGCSALGELQFVLARARHPAHTAMIAMGAGGAMGSALGRHAYFGLFEGGVFQLASGFGWFWQNGPMSPSAPPATPIDVAATLRGLPIADLVERVRPGPNLYGDIARTPFTDPFWETLDYVSMTDRLTTPALVITTWGDQTLGDTLALADFVRQGGPEITRNQRMVIAPGNHCQWDDPERSGKFGDLSVEGTSQPYWDWYLRWFDFWLRDRGKGLDDLPAYTYYMLGENRWLSANSWPPEETHLEQWYLDSDGHANGPETNGRLTESLPQTSATDEYKYDPLNPVPSRGGPVCCTGDPHERSGPVDQREIEMRNDVLVYTSEPLARPLRIAGPLHARLRISSSARDTDFIARLVHVWPDGRSLGIQEGALRARYRTGMTTPQLLVPNEETDIVIDMRSIAYTIPQGHRLRLDVTSSSFPRLERNLNTGGHNAVESQAVTAVNRVHHSPNAKSSFLELSVLPPSR